MSRAGARGARARRWWSVLLAGPVVGTGYFLVVYLAAEAVCAEALQPFGPGALGVFILAATAATVAVLLATGWRAHRLGRDGGEARSPGLEAETAQDRHFVGAIALVLAGAFLLFVVMIGAPVVALTLC